VASGEKVYKEAFDPVKHSGFGIVSLIISILVGIMVIAVMVF